MYRPLDYWTKTIRLVTFSAIKLSDYQKSDWQIRETIGLSNIGSRPQSIRLSDIKFTKNNGLPTIGITSSCSTPATADTPATDGSQQQQGATTARKTTMAGRPTKAGTAMNIENTSIRRDLNSSREGSNSRDSSHCRDIWDKQHLSEHINSRPDSNTRGHWNSRGHQQQEGGHNRWKHHLKKVFHNCWDTTAENPGRLTAERTI